MVISELLQSVSARFDSGNAELAIAREFLTEVSTFAFGNTIRLHEIEFYASRNVHPDPFAHCHPIQGLFGRWYVHRVGKGYKSGSFKGLDFTFGKDGAFGGVLIRSLESEDGSVVCGPSLCVDYLMKLGGFSSVADFDKAISSRPIWDVDNPLHFEPAEQDPSPIYSTARVGLNGFTIQDKEPWKYILRRYRFLSHPRKIRKGRVHLIMSLHRDGRSIDEIREITGSPKSAIQRHIDFFEQSSELSLDEIERLNASQMICALERKCEIGDPLFSDGD